MKNEKLKIFYWVLPGLLFLVQALFTFNSMNQIRYEELAESVRNVFWLQHRYIYHSLVPNIGWNGLLLIVYNIFGFGLHTAKFVRLFLHALSIICLALLLRNYLGARRSWVPLIAISLSPTFLYFNTMQVQYGIDVTYFIIALWLVLSIDWRKPRAALVKSIALWFLAMTAWISYPSFVYCLPILGWLYGKKLSRPPFRYIAISVVSFLLPLAVGLLWVKNRNLLIYDPGLPHAGLFRGNGKLLLSFDALRENLYFLASGLFTRARITYHFELFKVEFSDYYPIISLFAAFTIAFFFVLYQRKKQRSIATAVVLTWIVFFINLTVALFSGPLSLGGIHRATTLLIAFYAFYTIGFYFVTSRAFHVWIRWLTIGVFALLPLHHLFVYPVNLAHLKDPSVFRDKTWFSRAQTPEKSLAIYVDAVQKDHLRLLCTDQNENPVYCRYSEVYPAVAGYCLWNKLLCKQILGYDHQKNVLVPLIIGEWGKERNIFE